MLRKNKIIIGVVIACLAIAALGVLLGSLSRIQYEYYGLNYNHITANFSSDTIYSSGLYLIGPSNSFLQIPRTQRQLSLANIHTYTNDFFPLEVSADFVYSLVLPSSGNFTFL